MNERLYTVYQIADLLGAVPRHVIGWVQRGLLACSPGAVEDPIRVTESALVGFLKTRGIDLEKALARAGLAEDRSRPPTEEPAMLHAAADMPAVGQRLLPAPLAFSHPVRRAVRTTEEADEVSSQDAGARGVAEAILRDAVACRASAVHLEPQRHGLAVRFRVDGVLQEKANFRFRLSAALAPRLIGHLFRLAGLPDTEPQAPLSGRFEAVVEGRPVEFLLAACPTARGTSLVLHVRDREAPLPRLADLGLMEEEEAMIRGLLNRSSGLIVVTSPPKAGAGALLRAMLAELESPDRSLWAVQRPGALDREGASVLEVAPDAPGGFAAAVRAAGAQDPDVILIGQVPDPSTALAALEAALEGRLVLARMSCPTAPEAAALLLDMGLDPWLLTSALLAVTATAAVRGLAAVRPDPSSRADGAEAAERLSEARYEGRLTLTSTLVVDRQVAAALRMNPDAAAQIQRAARDGGVRSLWENGLASVQAGQTSIEELRRAGLDA